MKSQVPLAQSAGFLAGVRAAGAEADVQDVAAHSGVEETIVVEFDGQPMILSACLNTTFGTVDWQASSSLSSKMVATVAGSQLRSMLHDTQRCEKYRACISAAVCGFRATHGRPPVVLDIGAGSGLLSMFAAEAGAAAVFACEMFTPLAELAKQVTASNAVPGCSITVFPGKSTDLKVGKKKGQMPRKADMLVSELFDSILLGEGLIPTLVDAQARLLQPHAVVLPSRARILGQAVSSQQLHAVSAPVSDSGTLLTRANSTSAVACSARTAIPLHAAQVAPAPQLLTAPHVMWELDFQNHQEHGAPASTPQGDIFSDLSQGVFWQQARWTASAGSAKAASPADGVLAWWDVHLPADAAYWEGVAREVALKAGYKIAKPSKGATAAAVAASLGATTSDGDPRPGVFSTHPAAWTVPDDAWPNQTAAGGATEVPAVLPAPASPPPSWPWLWQDHWVQVYLPFGAPIHPVSIAKKRGKGAGGGATYDFALARDALSVWVDAGAAPRSGGAAACGAGGGDTPPSKGSCTCSAHQTYHPEHLAALHLGSAHSAAWGAAWQGAVQQLLGTSAVPPFLAAELGDGLEAVAAAMVHKGTADKLKLFSVQHAPDIRAFAQACLAAAPKRLSSAVAVGSVTEFQQWLTAECTREAAAAAGSELDVGLHIAACNPWFAQMHSMPLWSVLSVWLRLSSLRAAMRQGALVLPSYAAVRCVLVQLAEFHRGYQPAGVVCGKDHSVLDEALSDYTVTEGGPGELPLPLWQYDFKPLSPVTTLCALPLWANANDALQAGAANAQGVQVPVSSPGSAHALLVWVDYCLAPAAVGADGGRAAGGAWLSGAPPQLQYDVSALEAAAVGGHTPSALQGGVPRGPADPKQVVSFLPHPWAAVQAGAAVVVETEASFLHGAWKGINVWPGLKPEAGK